MKEINGTSPVEDWQPRARGITGSTLKIIAIVSMLLDHVGAIVLARVLVQRGFLEEIGPQLSPALLQESKELYVVYFLLRTIGRMAFPIFCFLLVEGFLHTRNFRRYLGNLLCFALLSEVPFDLAFSGKLLEFEYQNVFFTLFFGALAMAGIRLAEEKTVWNVAFRLLFGLASAGLCMGAAGLLKTDYDVLGVLAIVIIYLFRQRKMLAVGAGCLALLEPFAFVALLPVYWYNGTRGSNLKWVFYLFYPVHIFLLYLLACALGLGGVSLGF